MNTKTSCIHTRAVIDCLEERGHRRVDFLLNGLDPVIDRLPDPVAYLKDPGHWVSWKVMALLLERAKLALEDDSAAYGAARFFLERGLSANGHLVRWQSLWSQWRLLMTFSAQAALWNRARNVILERIARNEARVRIHWEAGVHATRDMCLYEQGLLTFMPLIWAGPPFSVEEVSCVCDGAVHCEFALRWPAKGTLRNMLFRLLRIDSLVTERIRELEVNRRMMEEKLGEVKRLNRQLGRRVVQLTAIQETGRDIISILDLDHLMDVIMARLASVCKVNRAVFLMVDQADQCLEFAYGMGFGDKIPDGVRNYRVALDRGNDFLVRVAMSERSEYVEDLNHSSLVKDGVLASCEEPVSVYAVPLVTHARRIGVIAAGGEKGKGIPPENREIMDIFASQIAVALENARLYNLLRERMEDLKCSRAMLGRAEQLSFLGNMAARIAHEIRNPLAAIATFAQMLPEKYNEETFRSEFKEIALEETTRVNKIVTEFLDLAKPREPCFEKSNLHELIDKMILLLSPRTKMKGIKVYRQYGKDVGDVVLDEQKMKQVVLNILSNAVEAVQQRGRIRVSTGTDVDSEGLGWVWIEVRDNGCGIDEDQIEKIFDPYWSTKEQGSRNGGAGLGLFIARQSMEDHRGGIEVMSRPKRGAAFVLRFPGNLPCSCLS